MNTTETKVDKFTGKWAGRPLEGDRFNRAIECMDACAGIADPKSAIAAALRLSGRRAAMAATQ
jgi:hypothetical protein